MQKLIRVNVRRSVVSSCGRHKGRRERLGQFVATLHDPWRLEEGVPVAIHGTERCEL